MLPAWKKPEKWRQMMVESIKMATTKFSSERMIREYYEQLYLMPEAVK